MPGIRQHRLEQMRPSVAARSRLRQGGLGKVHLHLTPRRRFDAGVDLRILLLQLAAEAFHRVVGTAETLLVDQILVDALSRQTLFQLLVDQFFKGGAQTA